MTVGELKHWLSTLPQEFDDLVMVMRKYEDMEIKSDESGENYYTALDVPLVSGYIDEESKECCLLDNASREFIVRKNNEWKDDENPPEKV